jgi:hypothetical protein
MNVLDLVILSTVLGFHASADAARKATGQVVLELKPAAGTAVPVVFAGAIRRWDEDGKPRVPIDPKAKIDSPRVDREGRQDETGAWIFPDLPPGRYDLVLILKHHERLEGFHYPPIDAFDPALPPDTHAPIDAREWIAQDIAKSKHYENRVEPLFLGGSDDQIRVLVQLIRDQPTSYDAEAGFPVATMRHEVWQYTKRYGAWSKDRRTAIFDRVLLPRAELERWAWVWLPALGGIEVGSAPVRVVLELPAEWKPESDRGWFGSRRAGRTGGNSGTGNAGLKR